MKTKYLILLLICLSTAMFSQTMKIMKTDGSVVTFKTTDIDSVLFTTASQAKTISVNNWNCVPDYSRAKVSISSGVYEDAEDGLKVYGEGNYSLQLMPAEQISVMNKTIYICWKINGSNVSAGVDLFESSDNLTPVCQAFSFSSNSGLINTDTWYFTRLIITGNQVSVVTAQDNYDNNGGAVIANSTVQLSKEVMTYSFKTTGDRSSYSVLAEARVE